MAPTSYGPVRRRHACRLPRRQGTEGSGGRRGFIVWTDWPQQRVGAESRPNTSVRGYDIRLEAGFTIDGGPGMQFDPASTGATVLAESNDTMGGAWVGQNLGSGAAALADGAGGRGFCLLAWCLVT